MMMAGRLGRAQSAAGQIESFARFVLASRFGQMEAPDRKMTHTHTHEPPSTQLSWLGKLSLAARDIRGVGDAEATFLVAGSVTFAPARRRRRPSLERLLAVGMCRNGICRNELSSRLGSFHRQAETVARMRPARQQQPPDAFVRHTPDQSRSGFARRRSKRKQFDPAETNLQLACSCNSSPV